MLVWPVWRIIHVSGDPFLMDAVTWPALRLWPAISSEKPKSLHPLAINSSTSASPIPFEAQVTRVIFDSFFLLFLANHSYESWIVSCSSLTTRQDFFSLSRRGKENLNTPAWCKYITHKKHSLKSEGWILKHYNCFSNPSSKHVWRFHAYWKLLEIDYSKIIEHWYILNFRYKPSSNTPLYPNGTHSIFSACQIIG